MTDKERFINTLKFRPVDQMPMMEIALWPQTKQRWVQEGMPPDAITDYNLMPGNEYFGLAGINFAAIDTVNPSPLFPEKILKEDERYVTFMDERGRTRVGIKEGALDGTRMSMDTYVDFPVKDRKSFADLKKRYEAQPDQRYPNDWQIQVKKLQQSDKPITFVRPASVSFGYYSLLRDLMGTERLSYMWYDNPALITECLEFFTDFITRLLEKALCEVKFDFYTIHEDMSGKGGPLIGPKLFKKFILPHYQRFIAFLKSRQVELVMVDTDGDFEVLVPLFLEAGVNGFIPMERASGMDPVRFRKQFGKSLCMMGGIDKQEIAKGEKAIDQEVERTIKPLMDEGGYIPTIDHAIPPSISYDHFRYYLERKNSILAGNR